MSYDKSKLRKEYKKVFNSSKRKDFEVIHAERSSLPLNHRLVWIPGKSSTSKHNNTYGNNRGIDSSSRTSTKCNETTDNLNHDSLLETDRTYTIINITANGSSKEKVPINALAETKQVIVLDRPQKKITTKENDCYLKNLKYNIDDCSLTIKNEQDVMSVTDRYTKPLDDRSLSDRIEDMIQEEKDDEFDIVFLNNQQELEIKTIHI